MVQVGVTVSGRSWCEWSECKWCELVRVVGVVLHVFVWICLCLCVCVLCVCVCMCLCMCLRMFLCVVWVVCVGG